MIWLVIFLLVVGIALTNIRSLKAFVDWLDKRYPPKVRFTQELHDYLRERIYAHGKRMDGLQETSIDRFADMRGEFAADRKRISDLEKSMAALKDLLAKGSGPGSPAEQQRRADFIATGRMGD